MPPKGMSTRCSGATTSQWSSQPIESPALEPPTGATQQEGQLNLLKQLSWQIYALIVAIQAIQHPVASMVLVAAP